MLCFKNNRKNMLILQTRFCLRRKVAAQMKLYPPLARVLMLGKESEVEKSRRLSRRAYFEETHSSRIGPYFFVICVVCRMIFVVFCFVLYSLG